MKPFHSLWIIGDGQGLVKNAFGTLQRLRNEDIATGRSDLYIHKKYRVSVFMSSLISYNRNALTRISNVLIRGLNEEKLLKRVITFTYENLFKFIENDTAEKAIEWLLNELWHEILAKIDSLPLQGKPDNFPIITLIKPPPVRA